MTKPIGYWESMVIIICTKNESNLTNKYWDMVPDIKKVWTDGRRQNYIHPTLSGDKNRTFFYSVGRLTYDYTYTVIILTWQEITKVLFSLSGYKGSSVPLLFVYNKVRLFCKGWMGGWIDGQDKSNFLHWGKNATLRKKIMQKNKKQHVPAYLLIFFFADIHGPQREKICLPVVQ